MEAGGKRGRSVHGAHACGHRLSRLRELHLNTKVQKAQFLLDVTERYFSNEMFADSLPAGLEHVQYDPEKFRGSDEERWLDGLLYNLDVVGRIVRMGTLAIDDVDIIAYQASRVIRTRKYRSISIDSMSFGREGSGDTSHAARAVSG